MGVVETEEDKAPSIHVAQNWYEEFCEREQAKSHKTNYIALAPKIAVGKSRNHQLPATSARNILQQKHLYLKRPEPCFIARSAGYPVRIRCRRSGFLTR